MTTRLGVKAILTFGAGWVANSAYQVICSKQTKTCDSVVIDGRIVPNRPALPIFGVVSAATPYDTTTGSDVATRVSQVRKLGTGEPLKKIIISEFLNLCFFCTLFSQIMQYGFPSLDNIRSFDDYVLSYDRRNKVANWVFEHLTPDGVKHNEAVDRSKCDFKEDLSIHPYFR